jgi:hypothetical protein
MTRQAAAALLANTRVSERSIPMSSTMSGEPDGCLADERGGPAEDHLTGFENSLGAAVTIQALTTARGLPTFKFKLNDVEITCIPEGNRVRILISQQTELTLDVEDVRDVDEAISKVGVAMGNFWNCIQ